ncbi:MAG: hypothetical protein HRF49_11155 [bacterium]|jgi:hypothetical protein
MNGRFTATGVVDEDGVVVIRLKTDLPPGKKEFAIEPIDTPRPEVDRENFEWPVIYSGPLTDRFSVDREDIYGERG